MLLWRIVVYRLTDRYWSTCWLRHSAERTISMTSRLWEKTVSFLASPKKLLSAWTAYSARWHWAATCVNHVPTALQSQINYGPTALQSQLNLFAAARHFKISPVPAALQSQLVPQFHIVVVCQAMTWCVLLSSLPFLNVSTFNLQFQIANIRIQPLCDKASCPFDNLW